MFSATVDSLGGVGSSVSLLIVANQNTFLPCQGQQWWLWATAPKNCLGCCLCCGMSLYIIPSLRDSYYGITSVFGHPESFVTLPSWCSLWKRMKSYKNNSGPSCEWVNYSPQPLHAQPKPQWWRRGALSPTCKDFLMSPVSNGFDKCLGKAFLWEVKAAASWL